MAPDCLRDCHGKELFAIAYVIMATSFISLGEKVSAVSRIVCYSSAISRYLRRYSTLLKYQVMSWVYLLPLDKWLVPILVSSIALSGFLLNSFIMNRTGPLKSFLKYSFKEALAIVVFSLLYSQLFCCKNCTHKIQ